MIRAARHAAFDALFRAYLRGSMRNRFHGVWVRGARHLRALPTGRPALCLATHPGWWDGFLEVFLTRLAPGKCGYCMMEERQMRACKFLRWIGAFSVDLDNPRAAAVSLRYAARLLEDPRAMVWLFPQARLGSPHAPIAIRGGASWLSRHAPKAVVLPVAIRYEMLAEERPHALVSVGPPRDGPVDDAWIRAALEEGNETLRAAAVAYSVDGFEPLLPPALSANKRWEWFTLALRGRLKEFKRANR